SAGSIAAADLAPDGSAVATIVTPTGTDGAGRIVAFAPGGEVRWQRPLPARPGPCRQVGERVFVTVAANGPLQVDEVAATVRGTPGAAVLELDGATGAARAAVALG